MSEELSCSIVKDLLPNYMEQMTSKETSESIDAHLDTCPACKQVFVDMKEHIHTEKAPLPDKDLKKFLNKTKMVYGMELLLALCIIGIVTCFIVDIAINRALTWSLITTGGTVFGYSLVYTMVRGGKGRVVKSMLLITVLILPFLALIQFVVKYSLAPGSSIWFWDFALPIALVWIAYIWIVYIICRIFKPNFFFSCALVLFLSIPGNLITNYIARSGYSITAYYYDFIFNALGSVLGTVVFIMLGVFWALRKKTK